MKKIIFICLLILTVGPAMAVEVPEEIEFAGMRLKLTEGARKVLKEDIALITKGAKGFQIKVDRANLHFPIIERIFKEENLPEDFKFLALQESALIPDAISSSKAVGYWQFKKESAEEVGLRVDGAIDERMNLVAASRGAAKYLKKNNGALNNWIYALLSYNLGLGGVKSHVDDKYRGAQKMVVDKDMHWYVIRFLAHKLAFEPAVGKAFNPTLLLIAYDDCKDKSLRDISNDTEVDVENLELHNKWLLRGKIPADKTYYVILPLTPEHKQRLVARNVIKDESYVASNSGGNDNNKNNNDKKDKDFTVEVKVSKKEKKRLEAQVALSGTGDVALLTFLNGVRAIKAKEGDTPAKLALAGGISTENFLSYNDMKSFEAIVPGKTYFLQPKRSKGLEMFYTVSEGETLREVSQKNGIRISSIRSKNRMHKDEMLEAGRILYLRTKRPKDTPVELTKQETPVEENPRENNSMVQEPGISVDKEPVSDTAPVNETIIAHTEGQYHEVSPGETLYSISRKYQVTVDSLKAWNNLSSNDIKPGSRLLVATKKVQEVKTVTIEHVVQPGETLYQISRKYNVKVEEIQSWNSKSDNKVSIGEKLQIRKP